MSQRVIFFSGFNLLYYTLNKVKASVEILKRYLSIPKLNKVNPKPSDLFMSRVLKPEPKHVTICWDDL